MPLHLWFSMGEMCKAWQLWMTTATRTLSLMLKGPWSKLVPWNVFSRVKGVCLVYNHWNVYMYTNWFVYVHDDVYVGRFVHIYIYIYTNRWMLFLDLINCLNQVITRTISHEKPSRKCARWAWQEQRMPGKLILSTDHPWHGSCLVLNMWSYVLICVQIWICFVEMVSALNSSKATLVDKLEKHCNYSLDLVENFRRAINGEPSNPGAPIEEQSEMLDDWSWILNQRWMDARKKSQSLQLWIRTWVVLTSCDTWCIDPWFWYIYIYIHMFESCNI